MVTVLRLCIDMHDYVINVTIVTEYCDYEYNILLQV